MLCGDPPHLACAAGPKPAGIGGGARERKKIGETGFGNIRNGMGGFDLAQQRVLPMQKTKKEERF
jgi:hypothetical protein